MSDEIKEIFIRMNDLIEHQFDKEYHTKCDLFKDIQGLLDYITNLQQENDRLNNIINELEKTLLEKIEAIKTIKDMLGEEAKIVNPHIEVLETEYKHFLDKLKELKENNNAKD